MRRAADEPLWDVFYWSVIVEGTAGIPTLPPDDTAPSERPYKIELIHCKEARRSYWRVFIFGIAMASVHLNSRNKQWFVILNNKLQSEKFLTKGKAFYWVLNNV